MYITGERSSMERLELKAKAIATKAHEGQTRWNKTPYITHPARVAEAVRDLNLIENIGDEHMVDCILAAAWLHDVVEDTQITLKDLSDFPPFVVDMVETLTHRIDEEYLDYILRIKKHMYAPLIKRADINDNLKDLRKGSMRDKYLLAKWVLTN